MRRAALLWLVGVTAGPLAPSVARADSVAETDAATRARLKELFKSGRAHYNLAEYREAIEDFKAAYRITPDPVFLFNIGQSQREMGDHDAALRSFQAYLRDAKSPADRADAEKLIDEEEKKIAARRSTPEATPSTTPGSTVAVLPETPAALSAEPTSRKGTWIALGVTGGLLLVGGAVALGVIYGAGSGAPDAPFGTYAADFH